MEKWIEIRKYADFAAIAKQFGIDPVTARILRNRELTKPEEIRLFLHGDVSDLYDPHQLKDADLLTDILLAKIKERKTIYIIGDYDIDGVMASYILKSALLRLGAKPEVIIPDRIADGYGLSENLVKKAFSHGADTILTCDNGIAALQEIALAKSLGMTVLVTDHHAIPYVEEDGEKKECTSAADAVVNAHQTDCSYPNKELCGAAVAWKVVCILFEKMGIPPEEAMEYLENVAFATVGDIMSLSGENRILVKEGLKRIHHTKNVGMRALIAQCDLLPEEVKSYHLGYVLGPCINASGRLETAEKALELLFEQDEQRAVVAANELVALNNERKTMTLDGVACARQIYEEEGYEADDVLVIYIPNMHESIAGIVAGRIRELYYKPTFILTDGAQGVKGSGRSTEAYSMYDEMCKCAELFTKFGGHPMAAGLSLPKENIEKMRRALNENSTLTNEQKIPKIRIDVVMPLDYVTADLIREFTCLEPFGKDNEAPVFADRNVGISRMWVVGKNQNVLRLSLKMASGRWASGIFFGDIDSFMAFLAEKFGEDEVEKAKRGRLNSICLSIVYRPSIHSYMGEESLQFEIRNYC